jgi:hypothetical protein
MFNPYVLAFLTFAIVIIAFIICRKSAVNSNDESDVVKCVDCGKDILSCNCYEKYTGPLDEE